MTNKEFLQALGMELKVARIRKNLLRKDVSSLTGLCINAIKDIENGNVDGRILSYKRISEALGVGLREML